MQQRVGLFGIKNRLNRPEDYRQVFRSSCRSIGGGLLLIGRQNGYQHARLGLAISRKKIRLAVDRNRLKRLVRESFRQHQQLLSGLDVVVVSHKQLTHIDNKLLILALQGHWQKISRCKNS